MKVAFPILYFALLVVVAGFAILWSGWPEKRGGWLLSMKRKPPIVVVEWHRKNLLPILIFYAVLFLLFGYLEYNALAR